MPQQTSGKRGRPQKTDHHDTSNEAPNQKKKKLGPESLMQKVRIARSEGEGPTAQTAARGVSDSVDEDGGRQAMPVSPNVKGSQSRPPKSKALELPHGNHTDFSNEAINKASDHPTVQEYTPPHSGQDVKGNEPAKRGRGRPRKGEGLLSSQKVPTSLEEGVAKRGRGRPRKIKEPGVDILPIKEKRGRGRPRKVKDPGLSGDPQINPDGNTVKRKRGRPRKTKEPDSSHESLSGMRQMPDT